METTPLPQRKPFIYIRKEPNSSWRCLGTAIPQMMSGLWKIFQLISLDPVPRTLIPIFNNPILLDDLGTQWPIMPI